MAGIPPIKKRRQGRRNVRKICVCKDSVGWFVCGVCIKVSTGPHKEGMVTALGRRMHAGHRPGSTGVIATSRKMRSGDKRVRRGEKPRQHVKRQNGGECGRLERVGTTPSVYFKLSTNHGIGDTTASTVTSYQEMTEHRSSDGAIHWHLETPRPSSFVCNATLRRNAVRYALPSVIYHLWHPLHRYRIRRVQSCGNELVKHCPQRSRWHRPLYADLL